MYFIVQYLDPEMLNPELEAVVFVGRDLAPGDSGQLYFQDAGSFREGVRINSGGSPTTPTATVYAQPEKEVGHIFDFEHALEELLRCSLRRKGRNV